MIAMVEESLSRLTEWCEKENYKGYDPYDGLNSRLFRSIPVIRNNRFARLIWIQLFKRSPLNLRPLTGVDKEYNPKALGLFLSGYCILSKLKNDDSELDNIVFFSEKLLEKRNREWNGSCWGYNFDWQARAFFQPRNSPTVVATSFIGCALLDAYEITGEEKLLSNARKACNFIMKDLNRTYDNEGNFAFSYSPLDKSVVFNASLLGSRLLARVYSYTGENDLLDAARASVKYCCYYQCGDGSWSYGLQDFHKWKDNFHTGYNLECISDYTRYAGDESFIDNLEKGLKFYTDNYFTSEGVPKYYNNSLYPIDIHCPAQLVVTLAKTDKFDEKREMIDKVLTWTIKNMQSPKGYFYYQVNRYFSSRIPYMRWAQAWMFYAFATYLIHSGIKTKS
jgi:rhamnogalacturonyl hydrolase YesR